MILMSFFSRVTYNDRMSPLDYDLFRKVQSLMGVTPDFFEVCLMVRFLFFQFASSLSSFSLLLNADPSTAFFDLYRSMPIPRCTLILWAT